MTTLSESLFPPSNRRRCVKGRTSYTESAESIMCSENINIDADDSYSLDHNGYDCVDSNEIEDVEEEPVTIDLQAFLSENPLLTEPASDCGVDSNINLSDCHSQFRVTSYQPDLSSSVIENVLTSEPAVTCEKSVLPELAVNSMLTSENSSGENESSMQSEDIPVAVTEESMSSKENVFVNGKKQSPKKFVKSKTHMGLSNPLKKYKNFVKMKDINKASVKVFGKYPVVKCEKLDIENFMKKNNIKVRNWPLLHNNVNKTKLSVNNNGTINKKLNTKKPNIKIPKLFKKPISFNKYISLPKSGSSVNKSHSILVDSLDAVAKSGTENDNFKLQVSPVSTPVKSLKSSGSLLYQGHRFPNVIKQNPVYSEKLVKIIHNDSHSQGNDSGVQTRKLPIITSVNKVGVNPKTFQFVSTKHLTEISKNTNVVSNLPQPVVETVSTPMLKDYTVIEPYVDDPASPVKPKPIITVPVEIIPSPELPKKESVAETPHVTTASTSAKQGKMPRSVFLNGAVKQISTPVRHDTELIAGKIDEVSKNKDLNIDNSKNVLDQCPSVLKAKNIVVGVMESVFSMTQKNKKVSKLKPSANRVQKNQRNTSGSSTLECQTYNTTLNDILFGFDEIDDFTDDCNSSLNSSSEISVVTPVSDASNNVLDSSPSWKPDKKEINDIQLTNNKSVLSFSDEKQTVKEHSEKDRKKRKLFESPHNSDTWSASECENENDIPRKKKMNPRKKRSNRLVSNLQKVTKNDVKANISSEPERTVDNISVQKSLIESLNPSDCVKKLKHSAEKRTVKNSDKSPVSANKPKELSYAYSISNQSELSIICGENSDEVPRGVPKSTSLRNSRNSHDHADRSLIKNKSVRRVGNESKPFSENVPNFNRNISKRLSRYKISSMESKNGGKYMKSNFKSELTNKRKCKTLIRSKKKLSKPDDIIREIKTITGGNITRGKSKKISYSSASEKESNDPEFDDLSDDSESETCLSKLRNSSPGRANSRKKVRTLKVLFKRAKQKKSPNNQSMDFNPLPISVLDDANNSNSMPDNNKSLNSTFREGEREKMDTSCKAESKIENDTFVCETKPKYFIVQDNVQCDHASAVSSTHQIASPVKISVNTAISEVDGTEYVMNTSNSADIEVNSDNIEVQDVRNLLQKIVETVSCEFMYTNSDFDEESVNFDFNNSIPELEVDSSKNLINLSSVNENIDLNIDAKGENTTNSNTVDPTSSLIRNLNTELHEPTLNIIHSSEDLLENKKPRMAKRKCPKIKISITKTVIDTDGREENWYVSERKPSTDSLQSEVSSEEAKLESEAEIICDKLNILPEASSIPTISEKDISQSVRTCDESLEHLMQGANDNNSNTDISSDIVKCPGMIDDTPHFSNGFSKYKVAEQQCVLPDDQQQLARSECSVKALDSFLAKDKESVESINPDEALNTPATESAELVKQECFIEAFNSCVIESKVSVEAECSVEMASSEVENEKPVKPEHSMEIVSSDVENEEPVKPEVSIEEVSSAVESEKPTKSKYSVEEVNFAVESKKPMKSEYSVEVDSSTVEKEEPVGSEQSEEIVDTSAAKKEEPVIESSVKNPIVTFGGSTVRFDKELTVTLHLMKNFVTDIKSPKSVKRKRNSVPLRTSGRSNVKVEASPDCSGKVQTNKVEKKSRKSSPHVTPVKKNYDPEAVTVPFTMVEKKSQKSSPHVTPVKKKNYDPEAVAVPFTMGWMRELVHRANQEEGKRQSDIYYFAPEGVKLRSMREVAAYLSKKGNNALTIENFTYAKELIYREPFEIERSAKQKASVCSAPSPSPNLSSVNTSKRKKQSISKKQTPTTHSSSSSSSSPKEHSSKSPKNDSLETARNSGTRKSARRTSLNKEECVKKENDTDSVKPRPSRKIIKKVPFDNSFKEKTPIRKCRLDNKQNSSTESKTSAPVILSDSLTKSNTNLSANQSGKLIASPSSITENTSSVNLSVDKQTSNQPLKTQKRYKVKCTYSKKDSMIQRPCTPLCKVAHYQFPSIQCAICLCLFHPSCVPPVSRGVKFACKPCTIVKLESSRLHINSPTASIPVDEINDVGIESIDSSLLEPEVICHTYSAALPVNCMSNCNPGVPFTPFSVPNLHFGNSQRKMFLCCSYSNAPTVANNPLSNYSSSFGEVRSTLNQLKILSLSTIPEAHGLTSSQTFPSNNSSFNFTSLSSHQQKCLGIPRATLNNPVSCRYMVYNIKKPSASNINNICGSVQHSSMNQNMPEPVVRENVSEFSPACTLPTVLTEQLKRPSYTYLRNEAPCNPSISSCSYQTPKSFVQGMEMECVPNSAKKTKLSVTPESSSTNVQNNHTSIWNNVSASKTASSDMPRTVLSSSGSSNDLKSISVEDNCRDYVESALKVIVSANNNSKTCEKSFERSETLCSRHQLIGEKTCSDRMSSSSEEATVNDSKYLPFVFKMLNICDLLRASQVCRSWRDIASQDTLWEKVSFCGQRVTDWDKCCQALKKHCTKALDLCGIILEDSPNPWEGLEQNLVHLGEVEELSFDKVSPFLVSNVAKYMSRLRILECPFVTVSFTEPEMWFVTCELELSSLRFLGRLEHLKIGSAGGIVLNGSFSSVMPYLPNLRHLALTGFKFYSHGNLECLAQMQQLISLELGDCNDIQPGVFVLLSKMRRLKKLRLENGGNVKDTKFAEALSKMEGLEQLELMNFQMPSLCTVLSELQHLEQINIWPDNATEGPLVNYNCYEAISRCRNLKYICWGVIAEGDTIPEVLELKASASESEIKKLTYKELFQKLVELFPKIKVEVKCVPRELWREFCSTRK